MSRFLESIAIVDGVAQRLPWHQRRVDHTLRAHYNRATLDLYAAVGQHPQDSGTIKCRILYDDINCDVQYSPYHPRAVRTLRLVENNEIDYRFKFADREAINQCFAQRRDGDDILIIKGGWITDSSIANIAFRKGKHWFTPREPLLQGTMREYLLEQGMLTTMDIAVDDLPSFEGYKLINAMLAFSSEEYPVSNIHF